MHYLVNAMDHCSQMQSHSAHRTGIMRMAHANDSEDIFFTRNLMDMHKSSQGTI